MAAYDPKRPRPAQLTDDPAPVEALLEPAPQDAAPTAEPSAPEVTEPDAEPRAADRRATAPNVRPAEVPVAPAPEVGTANRAVLYASIAGGVILAAVLTLLRRRSRSAQRSAG